MQTLAIMQWVVFFVGPMVIVLAYYVVKAVTGKSDDLFKYPTPRQVTRTYVFGTAYVLAHAASIGWALAAISGSAMFAILVAGASGVALTSALWIGRMYYRMPPPEVQADQQALRAWESQRMKAIDQSRFFTIQAKLVQWVGQFLGGITLLGMILMLIWVIYTIITRLT
ncbi:MAG: hypothetical protein HY532_05570 [Chloroflexi bacterium]|nr:hypothetical protein [Chloroflexota bacterium]